MGGAQPLAATMNGGVMLCVEVDESRIQRRIDHRYCDRMTHDLDEALHWVDQATEAQESPYPSAWLATAPKCFRRLLRRSVSCPTSSRTRRPPTIR